MAAYAPPGAVTWAHNSVPRYHVDGSGKLTEGTALLDVDPPLSLSLATSPYWGSIAFALLLLAGLALSLGFVLTIALAAAGCGRTKFRARLVAPASPGCCARACSCVAGGCAVAWYGAGVLVVAAAAVAAAAQGGGFKSSLAQLLDAAAGARQLLLLANATLSGELTATVANVTATAGALAADAAAGGAPAGVLAALAAIAAAAADAQGSVDRTSDQLTSGTALVESSWTALLKATDIYALPERASGGFVGASVLLALVALLTLGCVTPGRRASACFRWLTAPLLTLAWTATALAAAGVVVVALVGSDVCVDPASAVSRVLFNSTLVAGGAAPALGPSVAYYLQGGAACGDAPAGSVSALLAASQANVTASLDLVSAVAGDLAPALQPLASVLTSGLLAVNATLGELAADVDCSVLHGLWLALLAALCGAGMPAAVGLAAALLVASAGLLVALCASVRLCRAHPGDEPEAVQPTVDVVETMRAGGGLVFTRGAPPALERYGATAASAPPPPPYAGSAGAYSSTPWK